MSIRDHVEFGFKPSEIDIGMFLLLVGCSIIAMSCYTSYSNEARDQFKMLLEQNLRKADIRSEFSISFSWAYGLGWASTLPALVGTIISSFALFVSNDTGNPAITFKS